MNKVSIITCTYNRAEQFYKGMRTILNQSLLPLPLEIVIVDDGSTDNTFEMYEQLRAYADSKNLLINWVYVWIDFQEPRISCIPRNIGIKHSTGDIIIFTEPEALHVGETIDQLIKAMEDNPENTILASQVWTMGQRIYGKLTDDEFMYPARILTHPYAQLTTGDMHNTKAPDSDFAISGELNCNAGVLFATRKEWLMKVRGFDESFEGHGWDDFDLFNRLALIGHGIKKIDSIPVIHQWHEKNYPYNIYEAADKNGRKSEMRVSSGEYRANIGKKWGEN